MAKGQTQTLYSLAAVLGLVESGNKEDPFHMIVYRISGKTSVRELTPPEAAAVEAELRQQLREQGVDPVQLVLVVVVREVVANAVLFRERHAERATML